MWGEFDFGWFGVGMVLVVLRGFAWVWGLAILCAYRVWVVVLLFAWLTVFCVGLCDIVSCVVVVGGVFAVGEVFFCGWLMVWVSASFP